MVTKYMSIANRLLSYVWVIIVFFEVAYLSNNKDSQVCVCVSQAVIYGALNL